MYISSLVNRRFVVRSSGSETAHGDRTRLAQSVVALLVVVLLIAIVAGVSTGPSAVSFATLMAYISSLFGGADIVERDRLILETIRMPRIVMGVLVGSALALSGAVMQGLFRNPLADPGIVGVSSGAGLGAVSIIVLGGSTLAPITSSLGIFALPLAAFIGALTVTLILYRLSTKGGQTSIATLLLGGIAIAAFASAATGILIFMANDLQLRDLTFWGLGSLAGATWQKNMSVGPIIVLALISSPFLARGLNALALGEAAAHHIGIPVQKFKNIAIISVAAATGAAVAVSGGIGFIGIIVPHLLRLLMGPDNRYLLPGSALLGAALLLVCDAISRTIVAPAELPIGIISAMIGAPFFLWILLNRRGILDG